MAQSSQVADGFDLSRRFNITTPVRGGAAAGVTKWRDGPEASMAAEIEPVCPGIGSQIRGRTADQYWRAIYEILKIGSDSPPVSKFTILMTRNRNTPHLLGRGSIIMLQ